VSRHELPARTARLAAIINRAWLDIANHPRAYDAAQYAAVRILADAEIAAGLRDTDLLAELGPRLAALDELHSPRRWAHSDVVVCDHCQTGWKCTDRQILDGEVVETWPTWGQVRDLPLHGAGVKR